MIVRAYDDENFLFMDPSTMGACTYIPKEELTSRWHDEDSRARLNHFGIIVTLASDYEVRLNASKSNKCSIRGAGNHEKMEIMPRRCCEPLCAKGFQSMKKTICENKMYP